MGQPASTVTIVFVGLREMQALNSAHRGRDYATDVLSFSYPGEQDEGLPFLGEIVVAPEVASRNARRRRASLEAELRMLLVHGILHLVGYDHETDSGEMNRLQTRFLRRRTLVDVPLLDPVRRSEAARLERGSR